MNRNTTIAIAALALVIAAVWFSREISDLKFSTAENAKSWLSLSESLLIWSAIVLTIGLVGEWPEADSWKHSSLYKMAKAMVVVGVVGELLGDAGIFEASDRVQTLSNIDIEDANRKAKDAIARLEESERRYAMLQTENIELERAIAPRTIDQGALAQVIAPYPRRPIFISFIDHEEPKDTAGYIDFAISGIEVSSGLKWQVKYLPLQETPREGIVVQYSDRPDLEDKGSEVLAEAICKSLKSQGISARTESFVGYKREKYWPKEATLDAVLIRVGNKPNHFWENKRLRDKGSPIIEENNFCSASEFFEWARTRPIPKRK